MLQPFCKFLPPAFFNILLNQFAGHEPFVPTDQFRLLFVIIDEIDFQLVASHNLYALTQQLINMHIEQGD